MEPSRDPALPQELRDVAARLEQERPQLTALELDAVERRTLARVRRERPRVHGGFLRSRLAVTAVLVFGLLFSTAGAGLAISGTASSGNAASAQYPQPGPHHRIGPNTAAGEPSHESSQPVQPVRQTEATSNTSSLPFTGLAAIPILVGGLALLGAGLVLRRSTRRGTS